MQNQSCLTEIDPQGTALWRVGGVMIELLLEHRIRSTSAISVIVHVDGQDADAFEVEGCSEP